MTLLAIGFPSGMMTLWVWLYYSLLMFWLVMAIDVVLHQHDQRVGWILAICFAPIIGAVAYFLFAFLPRQFQKPQ